MQVVFQLEPGSSVPIYRQIIDQVQRLAASGQLQPGDRLPSTRQIAETLAINPMTVSKAYSLLEHEGIVVRERGMGMVIADERQNPEALLRSALKDLIQQAHQLSISRNRVMQLLREQWEDER